MPDLFLHILHVLIEICGIRITIFLWIAICILLLGSRFSMAQSVFVCSHTHISFFSSAPIEDISATSDQGVSAIDLEAGAVYFRVPVSSFEFSNQLMQAHFNAHYLETDRYPDARFTGRLTIFPLTNTSGIKPVEVSGTLTIHGVSVPCQTGGVFELKGGELGLNATFKVKLADYHIQVPKLLIKNIAEIVDVHVSAVYQADDDSGRVTTVLRLLQSTSGNIAIAQDSMIARSGGSSAP